VNATFAFLGVIAVGVLLAIAGAARASSSSARGAYVFTAAFCGLVIGGFLVLWPCSADGGGACGVLMPAWYVALGITLIGAVSLGLRPPPR
jgi:hypothetical protein